MINLIYFLYTTDLFLESIISTARKEFTTVWFVALSCLHLRPNMKVTVAGQLSEMWLQRKRLNFRRIKMEVCPVLMLLMHVRILYFRIEPFVEVKKGIDNR